MSIKQMQERKQLGLCFKCDEKFTPGHKCKKLFFIEGILEEEISYYNEEDSSEEEKENSETVHYRPYHSMP